MTAPATAAAPRPRGVIARTTFRAYPALAEPGFSVLWLGLLPGTLAFQMHNVVAGYAAFALTGSAATLGLIATALGAPMLLFSLAGGVVADRFPRRLILIATSTVQAASAAALAALALGGLLQAWHLVALAVVQGTAFAFSVPARQAYLAELAGPPNIRSAMALFSAGYHFSRIAGPGAAGILLALPSVGVGGAFVVMVAMYVLVFAALIGLGGRLPDATVGGGNGWTQLVEGVRHVTTSRAIVVLLALGTVLLVFALPYSTLMPLLADRVFGVGPAGLGLLYTAVGAGALVGSLVVAGLTHISRATALQVGLGVIFGVSLIGFAYAPSYGVALGALFLVGASTAGYSALNTALLLSNAEPRLYGRVMSLSFLTQATVPMFALPVAALADALGGQTTVALAGACAVVVMIAAALIYPPQRRYPSAARG